MRIKDELTQAVIKAYTAKRRELYKYYEMDFDRYTKEFWESVSELLHTLGADPVLYVDLLFEVYGCGSSAPQPNFLKSDRLKQAWKARSQIHNNDVAEVWKLNLGLFNTYRGIGRSVVSIATDDSLYLNDVFRYVALKMHKYDEIAKTFEEQARLLIAKYPAYKAIAAVYIPGDALVQ